MILHTMKTWIVAFCLSILSFFTTSLRAEVKGKIDVAPAFVHLDILESGHTVKRMDMWAARGDATWCFWKGLFIKPTVLYANGGASKGGFVTAGVNLGHYTPITDCWAISPFVGISYSHLLTKIDLPDFMLTDLTERFKSWSPYIGLEIYYNFCPDWRISASIQYAWSKTKTTIGSLFEDKSSSKGPNYGLLLEHDLSPEWSINIGFGYNISLSKERHGIRASGVKVGIARWF